MVRSRVDSADMNPSPAKPKRRWPRSPWPWAVLTAVLAAVGVTLWLLLSSPDTVSTSNVRAKVDQSLKDATGGQAKVTALTCPKMPAEKGRTYSCSAEINGVPATVDVTTTDDKGAFDVQIASHDAS